MSTATRTVIPRTLELGGLKINVDVELTRDGPHGLYCFESATVVGCDIKRFPGGNCPGIVTHVTGNSHGSLLIACLQEVVDSYLDEHDDWPFEDTDT